MHEKETEAAMAARRRAFIRDPADGFSDRASLGRSGGPLESVYTKDKWGVAYSPKNNRPKPPARRVIENPRRAGGRPWRFRISSIVLVFAICSIPSP